jgi:cysteine-S-conjugate beta-lyase
MTERDEVVGSPIAADAGELLRSRTSEKWRAYPDDVLPMFVAEMDFPLAPAIRVALHEAIDRNDTGYVNPHDTGAAAAFADFAADRWGWRPSPARMGVTTDVSVVIVESLRRLIRPGEGVVITPPVYPPFFDLIPEAGGTVVEVPLGSAEDGWPLDLAGIDAALAAGARAVLLCSPHNPVGRVHTRDELVELSRIVERHDAVVISDEIHAPLTHRGAEFTPYLSVSDAARRHGIAAESGSKAFNLAGLKSAFFVAESDRMTDLIAGLPEEVTFRAGLLGLLATREGFAHGRDHLDGVIAAIEANLDVLERELAASLPGARFRRPAASYLAWLDLSALGLGDDPAAAILERSRLALSSGPTFGRQGAGFVRMNVACAPEVVVEAVERIVAAAAG